MLRAIGATRASLVALSLARLAIVTLAGGVIAVAVAIAASPLMPIGPARLAEPHPGVEVNLAILAPGFAAIALLPLALLAGAAWRAARAAGGPLGVAEPPQTGHRSRLGGTLTRAGSVTGGVGVAMAFEPGRGRTAVPVRSALAGSVIAVAALAAAAVFGASLVALVSTPHDYGQNWDAQLDLQFGGVPGAFGATVIAAEHAVTGYASGNYGQLVIDGQIVPAIGLDQPRGAATDPRGGYLTMLAGRAARRPRRDRPRRPDAARHPRARRPDGPGHRRAGRERPAQRAARHAHHRGGRAARVRPRHVHAHRPRHRGRDDRVAAVRPLGARRDHDVPHQAHLLQLLPAPPAAGHRRGGRGGDADRLPHQGGLPAGLLRGGQRPAACRHQGLRRRQGHPARARRRAHRLRNRHPRARAGHRGAPTAPGPRPAQDPRFRQVARSSAWSPGRPAPSPPSRC